MESLAGGLAGLPVPEPQEGEPTIASKVTPEDLHLHWEDAAIELHRVVRLDRAWTTFRGRRLGILAAAPSEPGADPHEVLGPPGTLVGTSVITGRGTLLLQRVQPESRASDGGGGLGPGCASFGR